MKSSCLKFLLAPCFISALFLVGQKPGNAATLTFTELDFTYAGNQTAAQAAQGVINTSPTDGFNGFFENEGPGQDFGRLGAVNSTLISGSNQNTVPRTATLTNPFTNEFANSIDVTFDYAFLSSDGITPSTDVDLDTFTVSLTGDLGFSETIDLLPTLGTNGFVATFGSAGAPQIGEDLTLAFTLLENPGGVNTAAGFQDVSVIFTPVPEPSTIASTVASIVLGAGLIIRKKKAQRA